MGVRMQIAPNALHALDRTGAGQLVGRGATAAMKDAVYFRTCAEPAHGDFATAFPQFQEKRLRNDLFPGRSAERCYDALACIFAPLDYILDFRAKAGSG